MDFIGLLETWGVPVAITGILVWWLKKCIDKNERKRENQEKKREEFVLKILQTTRATNVLAEATARAVQRIPDAKCNGDMKAALEQAAKIQKEEKDFLINQGIEHIFDGD